MINLLSNTSNNSKKQIFLLSIPVFFANLSTPLVGIVDTGLMGNLGEAKYLTALSISTSVLTMIIWSFGFLRMGTVGIVSQLYAKRDFREIVKTLTRNFILAILIAVIIILIQPLLINLININFKTSLETQTLINTYVSIRVLSVPAELIIYILIGFYLGLQKTSLSSSIVMAFSVLNILFSSYFVLSLNLNVFGAALGTMIASYTTALIFIIIIHKHIKNKFQIIPKFEKVFNPSKVIRLLKINFDIFIRTLFLTFSFLWITYQSSKLGEDFVAVNAILMQFVILSAFFLDAYAFTAEGMVGYTLGKRNKKSFLQVVKNTIQISFFTSVIISIFFLIFFKEMINILTDIELLRFISYSYILWIVIIIPTSSFCYQLDGIFIGSSQTKDLRNAMMISVTVFIVISFYFVKYFDNHGLWLSLFLFMILRSLTLKYFFNNILRKF